MNEHDQDDALKQAYSAAKQHYPAPGRIKRAVIKQQQEGNSWLNMLRGMGKLPGREWLALTAALGCLLLLSDVFMAPLNQPHKSNIVALQVEYHGYQDEHIELPDYREKLTLYTREYTQQLATLSVFYSRTAQLASHKGNWIFTDCENQKINVSHELIDDLRALQRVDPTLLEGEFVALAFDKDGRLIRIEQTSQKQC